MNAPWANSNMPPPPIPPPANKDGDALKESRKKARKKPEVKKKSVNRKPKTGRVVLNSQARDIIARVYDFMKIEATDNRPHNLRNARWRTATAIGISEKTVSRILTERSRKKSETAVAGTGVVLAGKLGAVTNAGLAADDLLAGNFSKAGQDAVNAVGSVAAGDLAGVGIIATGTANAVGQVAGAKLNAAGTALGTIGKAAGQMIGGKFGAMSALAASANDCAQGNITGAGNDFGRAIGSVVGGDLAAVATLANGTFKLFGR